LQSQSELESQRAVLAYLDGLQQLTGRRLQQEAVLKADSLRITAQPLNSSLSTYCHARHAGGPKGDFEPPARRDLLAEFTVEMVPDSLPEESILQEARKSAIEMRPEIKAETIKERTSSVRDENREDPVHSGCLSSGELPYAPNISFLPQQRWWRSACC